MTNEVAIKNLLMLKNIVVKEGSNTDEAVNMAIEALKGQEEREKAICKEICDFIRGGCSTDTDDDKDFVCNKIQRCFTHFGRDGEQE